MRSSKTSNTKPRDPYAILGLDRKADAGQIKRAYFQLVREYPPETAPERFQEIRAAYEQLRTPERQAMADLFLLQPPPSTPDLPGVNLDLSVHKEDIVRIAMELALIQTPFQYDFNEPKLP